MVIIDGYNLMYAAHMAPSTGQRDSVLFQAARNSFVEWLVLQLGPAVAEVRLVFDGQNSTRNLGSTVFRGLQINYSSNGQTADDLIEALLSRHDVRTAKAVVVSNDRRMIRAAQLAGCTPLSCEAYLEQLDELRLLRRSGVAVTTLPDVAKPEKPAYDPDLDQDLLEIFNRPKKPR